MRAVTIRRMIVLGVCALGVGSLYLVPGVARSPEQIRQAGGSDEPADSAVGARPSQPQQSTSATGDRNSAREADRQPVTTASNAEPSQSTATRSNDRPEDADDRASPTVRAEKSKESKDSQPPQPVADIEPSKVTRRLLIINWPAAKDNVGVIGYRIWLNGFEVATTANTQARLRWFNDDRGEHVVQIRALDAAGNQSRSSPTLVIRRPPPEPTDAQSPEPSDTPTPSDQSESSQGNDQSGESPRGTPTTEKSTAEDENR